MLNKNWRIHLVESDTSQMASCGTMGCLHIESNVKLVINKDEIHFDITSDN